MDSDREGEQSGDALYGAVAIALQDGVACDEADLVPVLWSLTYGRASSARYSLRL